MVAGEVHGDGHGHAGLHGQHRAATCRRRTRRSDRPTWTSRRSSRRSWTSSRTDGLALQGDDARSAQADQDLMASFVGEVAGRARCLTSRRASTRWPNRSTTNWRRQRLHRGRRHRVHVRRRDRRGDPSSALGPARGVRRWTTVLLFMSPWIIGFLRLHRLPDGRRACTSRSRTTTCSAPAVGRVRQLQVHVHAGLRVLEGRSGTRCGSSSWRRPAADRVRDRHGDAADETAKGRRASTARSTSCRRWPRSVAAPLAFLFLFNPAYGPINRFLSGFGIGKPARCGSIDRPRRNRALVILALWGVGEAMIIFLAGLLDVPAQLYEAADIEGASAWQKFRHVTLPMISPGDLLLAGDRRDRRVPVLHAGLRREHRRVGRRSDRPSVLRRTPCCSTRSTCTSRASRTSAWATRRRWRGCCSSSR